MLNQWLTGSLTTCFDCGTLQASQLICLVMELQMIKFSNVDYTFNTLKFSLPMKWHFCDSLLYWRSNHKLVEVNCEVLLCQEKQKAAPYAEKSSCRGRRGDIFPHLVGNPEGKKILLTCSNNTFYYTLLLLPRQLK